MQVLSHSQTSWPRPPKAIMAQHLDRPPQGATVCVAGLVILRQRPGTAKGVVFITLEDESGTVNVVLWSKVMEAHRRIVMTARLMRVTGRLERAHGVVHVIAQTVEDLSYMLDELARPLPPER